MPDNGEEANQWSRNEWMACPMVHQVNVMHASLHAIDTLRAVADAATTPYTLICTDTVAIRPGTYALQRMTDIAEASGADMLYADYCLQRADGSRVGMPVIDYQEGSLRDDFDFGPLWLLRTDRLKEEVARMDETYRWAALYDLRLRLSRRSLPLRVNETLYTVMEGMHAAHPDHEAQHFAYVNPRNRERQLEMERVCTRHLQAIGGYLEPRLGEVGLQADDIGFPCEASVIIPVRNRVRTIGDAIRSALGQEAPFAFNVIVVDNHSTDGTTEVVRDRAAEDARVIHLVPERTGLGIGGCWNEAIHHRLCGRFAVQLDSDDLYSDTHTLRTMVEAFYLQQCAMVVGSYRLTDFNLNTLPPGVIDHREWTEENGRNNALRINGLGAPRAFYTPLLRRLNLPDTSYGEDYAVGLRISREYRIGRVYEPLYLCRRWEGNSDAAPSRELTNRRNLYKDRIRTWELQARMRRNREATDAAATCIDVEEWREGQLAQWPEARQRYDALAGVRTRRVEVNGTAYLLQHNPARIVSTGARVDAADTGDRPCFLCRENRPACQTGICWEEKYDILLNPYPIFAKHLTIADRQHRAQRIEGRLDDLLRLTKAMPAYTLFYNGPWCGASAPYHAHFQACSRGEMPIEGQWRQRTVGTVCSEEGGVLYRLDDAPRHAYVIRATRQEACVRLMRRFMCALPAAGDGEEPMLNLLCLYEELGWTVILFPRRKHRPACYDAEGGERLLCSPASVDLGGVFILPREEDFRRMTADDVAHILQEVCIEIPVEVIK